MRLALFDFDGTITHKDSLIEFIKFAVGKQKYHKGLVVLTPMLVAFKLKLISNQKAKEIFLAHYFPNWDFVEFQKVANQYALEKIDRIVKKEALERIEWHKARGDRVVVVSASIECWLQVWMDRENLELLATKIEITNDKLSGKFLTKNCYGAEKVRRIKEHLELDSFEYIYAYGDSSGDKEMLALANEGHYRPF